MDQWGGGYHIYIYIYTISGVLPSQGFYHLRVSTISGVHTSNPPKQGRHREGPNVLSAFASLEPPFLTGKGAPLNPPWTPRRTKGTLHTFEVQVNLKDLRLTKSGLGASLLAELLLPFAKLSSSAMAGVGASLPLLAINDKKRK